MDDTIHWYPPALNWVKLNFDGSVTSSPAAIGFVIRDSLGNPLVVGALCLNFLSVYVAECCALKDGLTGAKRFNYKSNVVEGDSLLTVNCVNRNCDVPWPLRPHIGDALHKV
ncbi:hypothetical protein ACLB2K_035843 [Fragaria x ananassa]